MTRERTPCSVRAGRPGAQSTRAVALGLACRAWRYPAEIQPQGCLSPSPVPFDLGNTPLCDRPTADLALARPGALLGARSVQRCEPLEAEPGVKRRTGGHATAGLSQGRSAAFPNGFPNWLSPQRSRRDPWEPRPPRLLLRSPGRASGTLTVVQATSVPNLHLPEVIASEADGVPLRSAQTCFFL